MWPFTKRKPLPPIDPAAAKAYKAGRTVYVRKIHLMPGDDGRRLSLALQRIEAAGYKLENQHHGGQGFERWVEATFRAVELKT
ncbi:hypothetical protein ACIF6L_26695 [Kitasatospora sp. NPDC086009]|uniref:hypothetical protein n=1 Tax=unclassified Kitasatospora TaxID=2633591 RepID=UPI0037C97289